MLVQKNEQTMIAIPAALRLVGMIGGTWAILLTLAATLAYLPGHPEFSLLTTYLSDIGATAGWPQIFFNSGTLIAAPIRYLVVVLLALRLGQLGAGRVFTLAILIIGLVSAAGTVLMTAVPFNVSLPVHKLGIPLYFLGVVVLQTLIGLKEWSLKAVPRLLPGLSFLMVAVYFVFAALVMLYERGLVSRNTPVIWEWAALFTSVIWVFAQGILLGRAAPQSGWSGK